MSISGDKFGISGIISSILSALDLFKPTFKSSIGYFALSFVIFPDTKPLILFPFNFRLFIIIPLLIVLIDDISFVSSLILIIV